MLKDFMGILIMTAEHQNAWHENPLNMVMGRNKSMKYILMAIPIWPKPFLSEDLLSC
jgi:hypothetical protein